MKDSTNDNTKSNKKVENDPLSQEEAIEHLISLRDHLDRLIGTQSELINVTQDGIEINKKNISNTKESIAVYRDNSKSIVQFISILCAVLVFFVPIMYALSITNVERLMEKQMAKIELFHYKHKELHNETVKEAQDVIKELKSIQKKIK